MVMASLERNPAASAAGRIDIFYVCEAVIAKKGEISTRESLFAFQAKGRENKFLK